MALIELLPPARLCVAVTAVLGLSPSPHPVSAVLYKTMLGGQDDAPASVSTGEVDLPAGAPPCSSPHIEEVGNPVEQVVDVLGRDALSTGAFVKASNTD